MDLDEFNTGIITEFREKDGQVGGPYEGVPMLLLHTVGRNSGRPRVNPLVYRPHGDGFVVFATFAGSPEDPQWYRNLMADRRATVEIGTDTIKVTARLADGDERRRLWDAQVADHPRFADYQERAQRQIPVVVLTPL
ncbi:MAG TPA: nitroreductase family deazaflavin-dependent oxidoreductase [Acidimicrobiia bacterium]|nr:nitroreductase family deazaflavin-dependent oxidoreductase [Acidimicrobiia bacterium]